MAGLEDKAEHGADSLNYWVQTVSHPLSAQLHRHQLPLKPVKVLTLKSCLTQPMLWPVYTLAQQRSLATTLKIQKSNWNF